MKAYLASRYSRHQEMQKARNELEKRGHTITSRWIDEDKELSDSENERTNNPPAGVDPPQFLIFDECHKLKTPSSQRTEAGIQYSELIEDFWQGKEFVVGLSGTPSPLAVEDWWSQCEVIRAGFIEAI